MSSPIPPPAPWKRPHGFQEIVTVYGDPREYLRGDGGPLARWERRLTYVNLRRGIPLSWDPNINAIKIRCHQHAAVHVRQAFDAVDDAGLWEHLHDYGGCYNWRVQRNSNSKLSTHCWGIALDIDVNRNPLGRDPMMDPRIVKIFEQVGFYWGGNFANPDGMHMQLADGY